MGQAQRDPHTHEQATEGARPTTTRNTERNTPPAEGPTTVRTGSQQSHLGQQQTTLIRTLFRTFAILFLAISCIFSQLPLCLRVQSSRRHAPRTTAQWPQQTNSLHTRLIPRKRYSTGLTNKPLYAPFNCFISLFLHLFTFLFSSRCVLARLRSCKLGSNRVVGPTLY